MNEFSEKRQTINKMLGEYTAKTSGDFMQLSSELKSFAKNESLYKLVDKMFRHIMEFNKQIGSELNQMLEKYENCLLKMERLAEEKRKLEKLFASGILFQSETEMKNLMDKAIDTIVKELEADEGFIVLVNEQHEIETIVAKNMNPDNAPSARELSTTIIKSSLAAIAPFQINDIKSETEFAMQNSIVALGLTAAICVPLISGNKVWGAVYIDRRNSENKFNDADLSFLIAFAKQVVKGLEITNEIIRLEEKLEEKPLKDFETLRSQFKSGEMIGTGIKLYNVLKVASKVSGTDVSVLILGENGTGKELLARAIHENSRRAGKPFVAVNCGAIPADLLESELFGYESGAFSGAVKTKPGRFEVADGGTIFLDEIGEMSVNLQAKLLRFIQTREIERLGGIDSKKVDVRFIAATNRNLISMINEKTFREDLYYRLKVIEITIPPLRERVEDIMELVNYFLSKFSTPESEYMITDEALDILERYSWPGNIRELESVIHRCVILSKSNTISKEDLPPELYAGDSGDNEILPESSLSEAEDRFRRIYITKILRKTGSKSEAARMLGINRSHLHKLISQLEITG